MPDYTAEEEMIIEAEQVKAQARADHDAGQFQQYVKDQVRIAQASHQALTAYRARLLAEIERLMPDRITEPCDIGTRSALESIRDWAEKETK